MSSPTKPAVMTFFIELPPPGISLHVHAIASYRGDPSPHEMGVGESCRSSGESLSVHSLFNGILSLIWQSWLLAFRDGGDFHIREPLFIELGIHHYFINDYLLRRNGSIP